MEVTIHEAKTHLSKILKRVEEGEEIIISRNHHPIARLLPIAAPKRKRPPVGKVTSEPIKYDSDVFAPMSDEELREWGL